MPPARAGWIEPRMAGISDAPVGSGDRIAVPQA
jgi:hypothetical protein